MALLSLERISAQYPGAAEPVLSNTRREVNLKPMVILQSDNHPESQCSASSDARAPREAATELGVQVAEALLAQGAGDILKAVYGEAGHE